MHKEISDTLVVLSFGRGRNVNARPNPQNLLLHLILLGFNSLRRLSPLLLGPRLLVLVTVSG